MLVLTPLFENRSDVVIFAEQTPIVGEVNIHQFTLDVTLISIDDNRGNSYGWTRFDSNSETLESEILLAIMTLKHCDSITWNLMAINEEEHTGMRAILEDTLELVGLSH